MSQELMAVLGCLAQPAAVVRDRTVVYVNQAARDIGLMDGLSVHALLDDEQERYLSFDGEGALSLRVLLKSGERHATVIRVDCGDLFLLSGGEESGDLTSRLLAFSDLAQSLRLPVANLFATASNLFPYLEQFEDPSVQRQMAVLNKYFYQLLRTIGNLSEARRLNVEESAARMEPVELLGWFRALCDRIEPLCQASGVSFSATIPDGMLLGQIDPMRLERAVLNLVSNALKHTSTGGAIRLGFDAGRTGARIRVSDYGDGMTADVLSGAFSRYLEPQRTDPRSGIGLGLPIARSIAAEHGGTVVLQSQPGGGTTAVLSFSLGAGAAALRTPAISMSGFDQVLVELADVLPSEIFDSENVN